ncbi:hypothetical protein [Pseudomonas putida]|uniref:hypothetical protein n=1 Tax=Pseudomonas putida TaxID=303 RepID=UPI0039DF6EDC
MIEALMMGGAGQGPSEAWTYITGVGAAVSGTTLTRPFPTGVLPGDLVVAVMSVYNDSGSSSASNVPLVSPGWWKWGFGSSSAPIHCVVAARYADGLPAPTWQAAENRTARVWVGVFRAKGWTSVRLESQLTPATPVAIQTLVPNTLVLNIGLTPGTTASWLTYMTGATRVRRYTSDYSPAMVVDATPIPTKTPLTNIYANATSGDERNLILTAF